MQVIKAATNLKYYTIDVKNVPVTVFCIHINFDENSFFENYSDILDIIHSDSEFFQCISDILDSKPAVTRKLRRRPNDPPPAPEKRRKNSPDILL